MTNGTSQGLFVIVGVVIFGIFILISYILFRDTLNPSLATIYCDSFEQVGGDTNLLDSAEGKCVGKFNNSYEIKGDVDLWFKDAGMGPHIWTPSDSSMRTINLKNYSGSVIEDNYVILSSISDTNVGVKQEAIDRGFGTNKKRSLEVIINGETYRKNPSSSSDYSNVTWKLDDGAKLKINAVNEIRLIYYNVHGGKTVYTIQVKIINE